MEQMSYADVAAIERQWFEQERTWERRIGMLAFTVARSMGAKVRLEDFIKEDPEEKQRKSASALKFSLSRNKNVKTRRVKKNG